MFFYFIISTFYLVINCVDCVYNPADVTTNCLLYCSKLYSSAPQRKYYNQTSQNCQHMNGCPLIPTYISGYYYDYATNKCYQNQKKQKVIQSPPDRNTTTVVNINVAPMVCVHGTVGLDVVKGINVCYCQLFWKNSGKNNSNGIPYKCDIVQTNLSKVFRNITTINGKIVSYDGYSPIQVDIMLKNALQRAKADGIDNAFNNQITINFIVSALPQQPLIAVDKSYILILIIISICILIGITIYENHNSKIQVTRQVFQNRLKQIIKT